MARFGLVLHGGSCCGVTHLYLGGVSGPGTRVGKVEKFDFKRLMMTAHGISGYCPSGNWDEDGIRDTGQPRHVTVYNPYLLHDYSFPAQTAGERVDAHLSRYIHTYRAAGVIEVAITNTQKIGWDAFLLERGFVEVGCSRNSNTQRIIHMYMLFYDGFASLPEVVRSALDVGKK